MKITFQTLDQPAGALLVVADTQEGETERLVFGSAREALEAVGHALLDVAEVHAQPQPRPIPAAPAPMPEPEPEPEPAPQPPPPTRRIGLMSPKKSGPPAGRIR